MWLIVVASFSVKCQFLGQPTQYTGFHWIIQKKTAPYKAPLPSECLLKMGFVCQKRVRHAFFCMSAKWWHTVPESREGCFLLQTFSEEKIASFLSKRVVSMKVLEQAISARRHDHDHKGISALQFMYENWREQPLSFNLIHRGLRKKQAAAVSVQFVSRKSDQKLYSSSLV